MTRRESLNRRCSEKADFISWQDWQTEREKGDFQYCAVTLVPSLCLCHFVFLYVFAHASVQVSVRACMHVYVCLRGHT